MTQHRTMRAVVVLDKTKKQNKKLTLGNDFIPLLLEAK